MSKGAFVYNKIIKPKSGAISPLLILLYLLKAFCKQKAYLVFDTYYLLLVKTNFAVLLDGKCARML